MSRYSYYGRSYHRVNDLSNLETDQKQAVKKIYTLLKTSSHNSEDASSFDQDLIRWSSPRYFNMKIRENHIYIQPKSTKIYQARVTLLTPKSPATGKEMATLVYHLSKISTLEILHLVVDASFFSSDSENPTVLRFRLPNLEKFKLEIMESSNPNYHHEVRFEDSLYPNLTYFNCSSFPRNFRNLSNSFFSKFPNLTTLSIGMSDPMHMIDGEQFLREYLDLFGENNTLNYLILREYHHELPDSIANLKNLIGISIVNSPSKSVYAIPKSLSNLKNLQVFDLWRYDPGEFPEILLGLISLRVIQIVHSSVSSIPLDIEDLKNLTELVIVNAQLISLPKGLATIKTISFLDFENNLIEGVSPLFFEKHIKLNLKNNPHQNLENKIHGYERIAGGRISATMDYHIETSREYMKYASPRAFRRAHRQLIDQF